MFSSVVIFASLPAFICAGFTALSPKDGANVTKSLTVNFYLNADTNLNHYGNATTISLLSAQKNYILGENQTFSDQYPVPPAVWANGSPTVLSLGPFDISSVIAGSYKISISTLYSYENTPQAGVQKSSTDLAYITVLESDTTSSILSSSSIIISSSTSPISVSTSVSDKSSSIISSETSSSASIESTVITTSTANPTSSESDSYSTVTVTVPRSKTSASAPSLSVVLSTTASSDSNSSSTGISDSPSIQVSSPGPNPTVANILSETASESAAVSQIAPVILASNILGGQLSVNTDTADTQTSASSITSAIVKTPTNTLVGDVSTQSATLLKDDDDTTTMLPSILTGVKGTNTKVNAVATDTATYALDSAARSLGLNMQTLVLTIALTVGALLTN